MKINSFVAAALMAALVSCSPKVHDEHTGNSFDINELIAETNQPQYGFLSNISTGDDSLDIALKKYILLYYYGNYHEQLSMTYSPAHALVYGNMDLLLKKGENSCEYYTDSLAYIEDQYAKYQVRKSKAPSASFLPFISFEIFSVNENDVDFRGYSAAVLIQSPNEPSYCVSSMDVICIKSEGRWSFYEDNLPSHSQYKKDRLDLMVDFMNGEGLTYKSESVVRKAVNGYTAENVALNIYQGADSEEKSILDSWHLGYCVMTGMCPGNPVDFVYKDGYKNIMGLEYSEEALEEFVNSSLPDKDKVDKLRGIKADVYPYALRLLKTLDNGTSVYLLDQVMAFPARYFSVTPERDLLIKLPGDSQCKIVSLSNQDDNYDSIISMMNGLLSKDEVLAAAN